MKNYGLIFKKFRKSRGLKLKDIARDGLSVSHISRFENGESELTISKFMLALERLNVSIDEFIYTVNDFHKDELSELLDNIRMFVTEKNIDGLKNLLIKMLEKDKPEKYHLLNLILVKIRLQEMSGEKFYEDRDIDYLTNYLFEVEYWGYYEILLLGNTLDVLNHDTFFILSRELIRRSDFYKDIPKNRQLICNLTLNAFIICIENEKLNDAAYFKKQLDLLGFKEYELYERLVFNYAINLFEFKKNKNNISVIEMKKCIAAMKLAGSNIIASKYESHLGKILKNQE